MKQLGAQCGSEFWFRLKRHMVQARHLDIREVGLQIVERLMNFHVKHCLDLCSRDGEERLSPKAKNI